MSNLVILNWRPFEHKAKFEKKATFIYVRNRYFFYEESFEDLQMNSDSKFQTGSFKAFVKLHRSPLLIANVVKGAVSGLKQFLATESP